MVSEYIFNLVQITYTIMLPIAIGMVGSQVKNIKAGKRADCLLLRKSLIDIHDQAVAQGYISRPSFQAFEEIWDVYHNVYEGNTLTDLFREEIHKLPIR